ncbi:MAG TPA: TRAP transporter substrate-binding protein DctP [Syntrophorhabdaceae bacterium]|nr:TRAP transporter substrate-binding protein DctP [Syntrophorhabdaceae bacterium]
MKRLLSNVVIVVLVCVISVMFAGLSKAQQGKVIELTYASPVGPDHTFSVVDRKWMEKIEKETNGRVKIKPFWGGTLIGSRDAIDEMVQGVADIGFVSPGYAKSGYFFTRSCFVFFYGANQEVGRRVFKEMLAKFPQIEAEYKDLKVLSWSSGTDYQLISRKPVKTLADLKGMRIKTIADLTSVLAKLGVEGMNMPTPEVYVNLQKGIVDGTLTPYEAFKSLKLGEVAKYATQMDIYRPHSGGKVMNLASWNKLPKDIQKIFENNIEWWGSETDKAFINADVEGKELAKKQGVQFFAFSKEEMDKFYAPVKELADKEAKALDARGLPGTKMYQEAQALIKKYKK